VTDTNATLRLSPLDAAHRLLGARFAPFGGWEMPIQYTGVLEEHRACRSSAVVFDVSHLGTLRCVGGGVVDALQWALTNDLHRIAPGRAQYTHLLDEHDAHVVDDLIVWWLSPEQRAVREGAGGSRAARSEMRPETPHELLVMPNASNTQPLVEALRDASHRFGSAADTVDDVTDGRAVLAVQGPQARSLLAPVATEAADVARFHVRRFSWRGAACLAAGTGYTGEDGVEVQVPAERARELWDAILATGIVPAGLGARDTLRLEAGFPLHGHELGPGITPLQAGLGWVVRFDKGDFRGRAPLEAERDRGVARLLRGMTTSGRQPPREGATVSRDDAIVGAVTSGNFSPVLGHGIAMGFLDPKIGPGDAVAIDVRGRSLPATVVELPFVRR
jgi:aminomethyltransferase